MRVKMVENVWNSDFLLLITRKRFNGKKGKGFIHSKNWLDRKWVNNILIMYSGNSEKKKFK